MKRVANRSVALSPSEIEEWLGDHLPYRIRVMMSWPERMNRHGCYKDNFYDLWSAGFEASLMHCRLFLKFLGLGCRRDSGAIALTEDRKYAEVDGCVDEVKVPDLGGEFVEMKTLLPLVQRQLAIVIDGANKASAHLTHESGHLLEPSMLLDVPSVVLTLLDMQLYKKIKRPLPNPLKDLRSV